MKIYKATLFLSHISFLGRNQRFLTFSFMSVHVQRSLLAPPLVEQKLRAPISRRP